VAKRSPILGYNHNVLYRGLVFHVQTEDSGQLSPHLFTHLFHGGVIISTRKLVYDAGSAEDSIKGLMQAQHKVVLKDLKKGTFDDKIDAYLVGTEGLLPRSTPVAPPPSEVVPPPPDAPRLSAPEITISRPGTEELDLLDPIEPVEMIGDRPSEPVITIEEPPPVIARAATPPPIPRTATPSAPPAPARTQTAERRSGPSSVRSILPPPPPSPDEIDPPTDPDVDPEEIRAAVNATVKTEMLDLDSAPEISIKLDLEDDDQPAASRTRSRHDTDIQSDGVPGAIGAIPSAPQPPSTPERKTGERVPALGAAALPPARPISRPPSRQAITPPAVMSRPIANEDRSDSVEVYAPPPSSADPPPGERSERPGQYAQHKKPSTKLPVDLIKGEPRPGSGSFPIPAGLSRPGRPSAIPQVVQRTGSPSSQPIPQPRTGTPGSQPNPPVAARSPSAPHQVPRVNSPSQPPPDGPAVGRTPTPSRVSPASSSPAARTNVSGGVVMTRPAVIVGAPAKPAVPPRVRKAREEEGRGFGQGLISEKSLDEVILAYLSEDADDK
jgi:hypothetical protein